MSNMNTWSAASRQWSANRQHAASRLTAPNPGPKGFSLVELMIGMTLGLILLLGVTSVLISNQRTYTTEDNLSRVQESARLAYDFIARDVRMAGYTGCFTDVNTMTNTLNMGAGGCGTSYDYDFSIPITGHEALGTAWSPVLPTGFSGPLPGTDVITMRGAYDAGIDLVNQMNLTTADMKVSKNSGLEEGDIIIISDCRSASIFQATHVNENSGTVQWDNLVHNTGATVCPGNASKNLGHLYPPGSKIAKIETSSYYIGTGQSGQPALFKRSINGGAIELVEGIENMQVEYGEDTDGDRDADTYRKANTVTNWARVVSARISLLARGASANALDASQPYTYDGQTVTPTDRRLRRVATFVVTLRNKTQ